MKAFVARQPIFDRRLVVRGYELLFRSGLENAIGQVDPDWATSRVIADTLFLPAFDTITAGLPGFINITRDLLLDHSVYLLPPRRTVLEIVESIEPDDEVIHACRELRQDGYRIALDDFRDGCGWDRMLEVADIVKVDVLSTCPEERASLAARLLPRGVTLLAEKVETHEMHCEAQALGYRLFQGYFFARPTVITGSDIPASRLSYMQVLREIHRAELDFDSLLNIIQHEVSLPYKLLRYVNSSYFGGLGQVGSLRQALMLLGETELRRWASVIALAGMASDKPDELVKLALLRARLAEQVAPEAGLGPRAPDLFLMGLFSLLDAILDQPLEKILAEIPIAEDVRAALLGAPGRMRDVHDLVVAYSCGDWNSLGEITRRLGVEESALSAYYTEAISWCVPGLASDEVSRAA